MKLRFHAVPERCERYPGPRRQGDFPNYIGRDFKPGDGVNTAAEHPASAEPFAIDPAHTDRETRKVAERCKRAVRRGDLYAADEATARACGVDFVELERGRDGEWRPAKPKPAPTKKSKD